MRYWNYHTVSGALALEGVADPDPLEFVKAQSEAFHAIADPAAVALAAADPEDIDAAQDTYAAALEAAHQAAQAVEPTIWLIPGSATIVEPPQIPEGKWPIFVAGGWQLIDIVAVQPT